MSWLSSWLKEIIVIVLIAGFADLLLPNKTMQRYVKLAVGMFLLIVMLSPILRLFRSDWNIEAMIRSAENDVNQRSVAVFSGSAADGGGGSSGAGTDGGELDRIFQDASNLRQADQQQARQLVEKQLQEAIAGDIENRLGEPVAAVQVTTKLDADDKLSLSGIQVYLADRGTAGGGTGTGGESGSASRPIEPIEPVTVSIGAIGNSEEESARQTIAAQKDAASAAESSSIASIKSLVSAGWQLPPDAIEVIPANSDRP